MTYCVALKLNRGLVFMSDTRTNAGVDNVSVFRKMYTWTRPGERALVVLAAGNLATTQSVISVLDERTKSVEERNPSLLETHSMFQTAQMVGKVLKDVIQENAQSGQSADSAFNATLILGGQIKGTEPRLFLIYPEGNFIESSPDTPFFQIGETKYGKPILVRAYDEDMSFEDATKLLMLSFDSTIKANLSVGLPLDVQYYEKDALKPGFEMRIQPDDPYYNDLTGRWGDALKETFARLPRFKRPKS
jgi:putative proteasome-type protease